jgi:hypothetical protein
MRLSKAGGEETGVGDEWRTQVAGRVVWWKSETSARANLNLWPMTALPLNIYSGTACHVRD